MPRQKLGTVIRREQIAQAALGLVATGGLRALSMVKLARRVGIAPSAIYRHFKSKDEVLVAALDMFRSILLRNIEEVCAETPVALDRLKRLLLRQAVMIRENAAIMPRLVFSEDATTYATLRPKAFGVLQLYLEKVGAIIRGGQSDGTIVRDLPPDTIALMMFGILVPAGILWHVTEGRFNVTRHVELGWQTLRRSIEVKQSSAACEPMFTKD